MITMNDIHRELGNAVCRDCINKRYNTGLVTSDCYYETRPRRCNSCGEVRNIVFGFKANGKIKMS